MKNGASAAVPATTTRWRTRRPISSGGEASRAARGGRSRGCRRARRRPRASRGGRRAAPPTRQSRRRGLALVGDGTSRLDRVGRALRKAAAPDAAVRAQRSSVRRCAGARRAAGGGWRRCCCCTGATAAPILVSRAARPRMRERRQREEEHSAPRRAARDPCASPPRKTASRTKLPSTCQPVVPTPGSLRKRRLTCAGCARGERSCW